MQINSNNNFAFEGFLVNDPKFNTFETTSKTDNQSKENAVVRFKLALEGGKNGNSHETAYIAFEAWDTAADRLAKLKKGDKIAGFGILRNNKWVDKQTGEERHEVVVRISRFYPVRVNNEFVEYDTVQD